MQKLVPLNNQAEWEQTLQSVPHTYAHTHWYNLAMHLASKREIFLYTAEADNFRAICPISLRKKYSDDPYDVTTPYGFSGMITEGFFENYMETRNSFFKEQGFVCGHFAMHPFFQNELGLSSNQLFPGKKAYYIDLRKDIDTLYSELSTDHRQRLKQWINKKYKIETTKSTDYVDAFVKLYDLSLQNRNTASIYNFGAEAWKALINSEFGFLFSIVVDNEIEASALFICFGDMVDYYMIASTPEGRQHARGIIWEAIQFFKNQNLSWMQLGCGVRDNDSLEQFKARFGGIAHTTYSLRQIYNSESYQALCEKYQTDPDNLQGYFPSYWQN